MARCHVMQSKRRLHVRLFFSWVDDINHRHSTLARLALAAVLGAFLLLGLTVGASANPSIRDKQAQAQAILAQVEAIGHEVGDAAERYNGATYELGQLTTQLTETREDLVLARGMQETAQDWLAKRVRALYINGESGGALEVILGAESLDDLLTRIDLAERVTSQDGRIAREVELLRERVAKREQELASARARQVVVVQQRAAEKQAIETKLAEQQRLLSSVRDEIARLEEAERRRQAELRRQAQLALERQRQLAAAQQRAAEQAAQAAAARPASRVEIEPAEPEVEPAEAPGVDYVPPPADASRGAQVVAIAMQYLGTPYVWAASDPSVGFDCSGLTKYVFAKVGVSLPHYAAAQYQLGSSVSKDQLQPGDLVFFRGLGHMGMYIGGGNMIHAPRTGDVVKISSIYDSYYVANWVGARRVL